MAIPNDETIIALEACQSGRDLESFGSPEGAFRKLECIEAIFQVRQFSKDFKRMKKQGEDLSKVKKVVGAIAHCEALDERHCDHAWVGIKRRIACCLAGFLSVYTLSYVGISTTGQYEPWAYGLLQGPDAKPIPAPKAAFGYRWVPFDQYAEDGTKRFKTIFFLPLIALDRKIWHTETKMNTGRYRVKNFFDYKTMTYREFNPN